MLSLTQEGVFHLEGTCDDSPTSSEEDEQRSPDEGVQFVMPSSGSQSSLEGGCSPPQATPPQSRPQSSTTLREATPVSEVVVFDRNRSMSYPRRRRPSSAGTAEAQCRQAVSVMVEDRELMCESLDSGLAASSETSIASNDSGLQYSTLGVSAFCIFQGVKSMLDHK